MPRLDKHHNQVKTALRKEGWTITHDPYIIDYFGLKLYADLGAERLITENDKTEKVCIEIKVFSKIGRMSELQKALGQYLLYQEGLMIKNPERELYLAISVDVWKDFFRKQGVVNIVNKFKLKLLIFDPVKEEVLKWIR